MKAVVLVGGLGTRLRPLTLRTPKQMLPVAGRPLIERVVAHLGASGVDGVVLSLAYRPDAFRNAYPDGACAGVPLTYVVEPEPLDTAGAVGFAAREAGIDERFLVVNGDVLTDLDVAALVSSHHDAHEGAGAEATIQLVPVDDPSPFGAVTTGDDGKVVAFVEKPAPGEAASGDVNAGYYVFEPEVIERLPACGRANLERETFPAMVADGVLYARSEPAWWVDVGSPERFLQASLDLLDRQAGEPVLISADAVVATSATVTRSFIGHGARIGRNARVEGSIVFARAVVGNGAVVRDSVVGAAAVVGDAAMVRDLCVLGNDIEVEGGTELAGALLPDPASWPAG